MTPTTLSRRTWMHQAACLGAGSFLTHPLQAAKAGQPILPPLNRFPRMVQEFYLGRVREQTGQSDAIRAALNSPEEARLYVETVRRHIRISFGPEPAKTPLNTRITGIIERPDYRIEKCLFESRPGFLVTANLYVPKHVRGPMPGVVATCGHSSNGKAEPAYQSFCQGLVRMGYVVLIYDPIGQGERLQYLTENLRSSVGVGVAEHLLAGISNSWFRSSSDPGGPGMASEHWMFCSREKRWIQSMLV